MWSRFNLGQNSQKVALFESEFSTLDNAKIKHSLRLFLSFIINVSSCFESFISHHHDLVLFKHTSNDCNTQWTKPCVPSSKVITTIKLYKTNTFVVLETIQLFLEVQSFLFPSFISSFNHPCSILFTSFFHPISILLSSFIYPFSNLTPSFLYSFSSFFHPSFILLPSILSPSSIPLITSFFLPFIILCQSSFHPASVLFPSFFYLPSILLPYFLSSFLHPSFIHPSFNLSFSLHDVFYFT